MYCPHALDMKLQLVSDLDEEIKWLQVCNINLFCTDQILRSVWYKKCLDGSLYILTLKTPRKNASEKYVLLKSSAANNCLTLLTHLSIEANRVDPDHTAPIGAVWSGSTLFVIEAS